MLTALLRWMNQARKDQRSVVLHAPRWRTSPGGAIAQAYEACVPLAVRRLWGPAPVERSLTLEVFEDRLLFNAVPAPMPAPAPAEVVVVAPVDAAPTDSATTPADAPPPDQTAADTEFNPDATEASSAAADAASDSASTRSTFIVVDPTVENYEQLLDQLSSLQTGPNDILVLDLQRDGLEQITERLEQLGQTQAVHIISHGDESGLHLGSNWLSADTIAMRASTLTQWQQLLTADADVLFYGCDLAANLSGQQFLQTFGTLTGADVAASTNATGAADLGGDWTLEYQFGDVQTRSLASQTSLFNWEGLLTTNTYRQGNVGYASASDTSISASTPTTSAGASTSVTVGGAASSVGLIQFGDIFGDGPGQIPLGSTITSASLRLNVTTGTSVSSTIGLYRVQGASWTSDSTWDSLGSGLTRDGVEVSTVADAIVSDTTQMESITLTGLQQTLQAWSNGQTNNGWALFGDNTTNWAFTSSDGATAELRPMLIVDYTPPAAPAVELRSTGEFRVNSTTTNTQTTVTNSRNNHDSVGIDANGNYVVVWSSDGTDGSGQGVYGQRYNNRGVAQGAQFRINQTTSDNQQWASVAMKADGSFVVTWTSAGQDGSGQGIYARSFNSTGVGTSEFRVNTTTSSDQKSPAIGMASDGSFVIAWEGNGSGDSAGIYAQRFDSSGVKVGGEFQVNAETSGTQADAAISVSQDGQFMVVWDDTVGTKGRRFNADGTAKDVGDLLIHADATSGNADVATNGNGNYHIVWRTTGSGDGSGRGLWQLNLNASDTTPGTPVAVTASTVNDQTEPSITSAVDGDYIVMWQGAGSGDTDGVFARKFLSNGTAVGAEFQLNTTTTGSQVAVSGAMLNLNDYVTVWSGNGSGDSTGVFARSFGTLSNQSSLLLTTDSDVSASGSSSLPSWTTGDVIGLGEPNLALGDNTTGQLWSVGNLNALAGDGSVKVDGLDVIQHNVLVAVGTKQIQLYAGDVLFSVAANETLGGIAVQSDDILVFRPSAPGNYAYGTILVLFDGMQSVGGAAVKQMTDFDLVDRDTQMGDVTLHAGDLILADQANGGTVVKLFRASSAGLGTTAGVVSTLLNGSDVGLGNDNIIGLQFIERDVQVGGMTLQSGDLLITTNRSTNVGANALAVTRNDVARLSISNTSVNGTAIATASLVVDGSDVALDSSAEAISTLALVQGGASPQLSNETYTVPEDGTFSSQSLWNLPGWNSRMQLTFDNSSRTENLTDFPVLVTLDANRFDYSLAKADGSDLRFVDPDGTVLSYEIETWNPQGKSVIWVKIPKIDASSSTDSIWMYYGNASASSAQNAAAVWSNGYVGVWHMSGSPLGTGAIQDSSSVNNDGTSVGMDATNQINGPVGGALNFDGSGEYIRIDTTNGDATAVDPARLTIEAWAQSTGDTGTEERIVNRRNVIGLSTYESYGLATSSSDRTKLMNTTGSPDTVGTSGSLPEDRWRYVTGVLSGSTSSLYVDGVLNATQTGVSSGGSGDYDITIGGGETGLLSTVSQFWKGGIDEVRLSNVARSAAWTSAQYASMTDTMISYGDRQTVSGLLDNDRSPTGSALTVTRVDTSSLAGTADVTVLDDGRLIVTPHMDSLAVGQTLTKQLTYTVMDANGNSDTATATVVIQGVNDAPVINTAVGPLTLSAITEDTATTGNTVASILASAGGTLISDVDSGAVQGIAVTAADQTHGNWQYSLNGTTWLSLGGVSDSSATLLSPTARIRFVPATDFNGDAGAITFRAWDQTSGINGQAGVNASLNGGSTALSIESVAASIQVTAVNDAPTFGVNTGATVLEGGSVVLTNGQLRASDVDDPVDHLVYTVTLSPVNGRLERVTSPGVAVTTFTQNDIDSGALQYVHNGGESLSDSISLTVSDGLLSTSGTFAITVTPQNDPPMMTVNTGATLAEGGNVIVSSTKLSVSDVDNTPSQLVYAVTTTPANGHLERVTAAGVAVTSFTQADLNSSLIRYVHDGSETVSDSFDFSLSDGGATVVGSFSITVTPVNDPPRIVVNSGVTVLEGDSVVISSDKLTTSDAESGATQLVYTVTSSPAHGRLEKINAPGTAITSFTQADLDGGAVRYVHDGGESTTDSISFTVSDGAASVSGSLAITVTPVNDAPVIATNVGLSLSEGGSSVIRNTKLRTTDVDNTSSQLVYTVTSSPANGRLERVSAPGTAITSFTQSDINSLVIRYVHNGGETTSDSFAFTVSDRQASASATFAITVTPVNDSPVIATNLGMTLPEGGSEVLTSTRLAATDPDNTHSQLYYTVTSLPDSGWLERVTSPGQSITGFTQADLNNGAIRYVHDGSEAPTDSFSFTLTDGSVNVTGTFTMNISPVNDPPTLATNLGLSVIEGGSLVIPNSKLLVNDVDNTAAQLVYTVTAAPAYGRLERVTAPGVAITTFTQADLNGLKIRYVHDGSETTADSFAFSTSDGAATVTGTVAIGVIPQNDAPVIATNLGMTLDEGGTAVLDSTQLSASDADNTASQLVFTVTSPASHGYLERVTTPGTSIASFSQAELDGGLIRYVHDGGESTSDTVSFSVSDGSASVNGSFSITVNPVDDLPVLVANSGITVLEGGTMTLTSGVLNTTDAESGPAAVTYTITNPVSFGHLALTAAPNAAITSFTQAQINSNQVIYVHSGAESTADDFNFSVTDGNTTLTGTFSIAITPVNDIPSFDVSRITLSEGEMVILNSYHLLTNDDDATAATLTYTVEGVSGGQFEWVATPGTAITSFTQEDITSSLVQFVHDGEEDAPVVTLSVSDGVASVGPRTMLVSFSHVNDAPVLQTNAGLTMNQGSSAAIGSNSLSATDPDNTSQELVYTVTSNPQTGRLELNSNPGVAIQSFTQEQLNSGEVHYVHDDSDLLSDSFNFSLTDGAESMSGTFSITMLPVNHVPRMINHSWAVEEGGTVVLTDANLWATDRESSSLTFQVESTTYGMFWNTDTNQAVTAFTTEEVAAGVITYTNDGSELAPSVRVSVSDGVNTSDVISIDVDYTPVNDPPAVAINSGLTLSEGGSQLITTDNLSAFDPDNASTELVFTVTQAPLHGVLEIISDPGMQVTSFTQDDLLNGRVRYVHDGGETTADSWSFTLSDGSGTGDVNGDFSITIQPVDDAPTLATSPVTISEGGTVVLSGANVSVTDPDSIDFVFSVSIVTHGYFKNTNTGLEITSFTQSHLLSGVITFVHDGGEVAPTASVSVADASTQSPAVVLKFVFTNVNDAPVVAPSVFTVPENSSNGTLVGQVNIVDPDVGDTHVFSLLSGPGSSNFAINSSTGEITVADGSQLNFEQQATYELKVQVVDSAGVVAQSTFQIQLENVNEVPAVKGLADVHSNEDQPIAAINLKTGWTDPESEAMTFQILSSTNPSLLSSATITPDGMLVLNAAPNAYGMTVLELQATDAHGLTARTTLKIVIAPVNDVPVSNNDVISTKLGTPLVFSPAALLANDTDVDSTNLNVVIRRQPQHGLVFSNGDGTFTYLPIGGFSGIDTFEYATTDGLLLSANAVVSVNVAVLAPSPAGGQVQAQAGDAKPNTAAAGATATASAGHVISSGTAAGGTVTAWASSVPSPNSSITTGGDASDKSIDGVAPIPVDHIDQLFDIGHRGRQEADGNESMGRARSANDSMRFSSGIGTRSHLDHGRADDSQQLAYLTTPLSSTRIASSTVLALQANQVAFDQVKQSLQSDLAQELVFEVPALAGASLSVGYVVWMLRGGVLITSLLAQMPAWRIVDPLVVLDSLDKCDEDDESIGSLVEQGQSEHEPAV